MVVNKNGLELQIDSLSDGEKNLFALVGDIARRISIANPFNPEPFDGNGIVLIDEIDLHLHPSWQRMVIPKLCSTFKNIQFIVTTHSPQVLSEVAPRHVRLLSIVDNKVEVSPVNQTIGLNSTQILKEIMGDTGINAEIDAKISEIAGLIDQDDFKSAKEKIAELKVACSGYIPAILEAESTIFMLEPVEGDKA